jgi:hypothetical protein
MATFGQVKVDMVVLHFAFNFRPRIIQPTKSLTLISRVKEMDRKRGPARGIS